MAVGMSGVHYRPRARGVGRRVVSVEHPGCLPGPQHCHVSSCSSVPCFSEQNKVAASALR